MNWKTLKNKSAEAYGLLFISSYFHSYHLLVVKEFKGLNWIHYPWDFLVIIIVALIFYQLGAISSFESVYFRRAKKMNSNMGDKLRNVNVVRNAKKSLKNVKNNKIKKKNAKTKNKLINQIKTANDCKHR